MDAPQLRQRAPIVVDAKPANVPASPAVQSDLDDGLEPFTPPNFTIKDLLGAIPQHCFERSAWRSSLYVLFDAVVIGACAYAASFIDSALGSNGYALNGWPGFVAKWAAWNVYWFIVGCAGTGLWVIAHECEFSSPSFSPSPCCAVVRVLARVLLAGASSSCRRAPLLARPRKNSLSDIHLCTQAATRLSPPPSASTMLSASSCTASCSCLTTAGASRTAVTTPQLGT